MPAITLTWSQLLFLAFLVLAVYAIEMAWFFWRLRRHHFVDRLAQARLQRIEEALERLERGEVGASTPGKAKLEALPEPRNREVLDTPYAKAIVLAREGRDALSVAADCGLSRGEAELIVALYGPEHRP